MIKKCLFTAAGYGTRFLPATKAMPKEILPVVNKPLVQYGVEEAVEAGLNLSGALQQGVDEVAIDGRDRVAEVEFARTRARQHLLPRSLDGPHRKSQ